MVKITPAQILPIPYALQAYIGTTPPVASTTYYNAWGFSLATTTSTGRLYIPNSGTIVKVYVNISSSGTVGTSETSTISVRLNNTTDTTVSSSVVTSTGVTTYNNTALAIAVVAGDYINLKWAAPAWVTPPGSVAINVTIFIS